METLKARNSREEFLPLLRVSVASSLLIGLSIAGICICFPEIIFGILTNHSEITGSINTYVWYLSFILTFYSVSSMLEGYFLGLAEGKVVRNVTLLSAPLGFIPPAIASWYFHNNDILWLSSVLFRFVKLLLLLVYLPKSLSSDAEFVSSGEKDNLSQVDG
ncbi:MAG: MATE family efflux transporter [Microcoleus sp.]